MCNECKYEWEPIIFGHISTKSGCPKCSKRLRWNRKRFIGYANFIHGNKYNYDLITHGHIQNKRSKVPVICNTCGHGWNPTIHDHINGGCGCPRLQMFKRRIYVCEIFDGFRNSFIREFRIPSLPTRRYDFMFEYDSKRYLLEFDGIQHFEYIEFFHLIYEAFIEKQTVDRIKTEKAIEADFKIIRIDHTNVKNVGFHIQTALNSDETIYVSNKLMYQYLF